MFFTILKGDASVVNPTRRLSAFVDLADPESFGAKAEIILQQLQPQVILNLRVSVDAAVQEAVRHLCGCELPELPNSSTNGEAGKILKLGPNEWLLIANTGTSWSERMAIPGATLTDVSHARVAIMLDGGKSREMLAKGCTVDLHPSVFPPGTCIQTSIAKIGVIVHKQQSANDYTLYAARSYAGSFWHWLSASAKEYRCQILEPLADDRPHH